MYIARVPTRPSSPPAPVPPPPYGVVGVPAFRFRALAALAARTPPGEGRETALACLMGARLASATLPPYRLGAEQRHARAADARPWLATLALPAGVREAVARLMDGTGDDPPAAASLAALLRQAMDAAGPLLDDAARAELTALARALDAASPA